MASPGQVPRAAWPSTLAEVPGLGTGLIGFPVRRQRETTGCDLRSLGGILSPGQVGGCWAGNEDMLTWSEPAPRMSGHQVAFPGVFSGVFCCVSLIL